MGQICGIAKFFPGGHSLFGYQEKSLAVRQKMAEYVGYRNAREDQLSNVVSFNIRKPGTPGHPVKRIVKMINGKPVEFVNWDLPIEENRPLDLEIERPAAILATQPSE